MVLKKNTQLFSLLLLVLILRNGEAVLGPIPITMQTEYRTSQPVISSIASSIKLDREEIKATGANTFLELLATLPALNLFNPQGNVAALFLRGHEARHTLVLIDGVKVHDISSPDAASGYALEAIPLSQIERIEIIKGPSSLYGSGAIAGVIAVFTKGTSQQGEYASIDFSKGSHRTQNIILTATTKEQNDFINISASQYRTQGISALKNNSEKDGIHSQAIALRIGYDIKKNTHLNIDILSTSINTEYDDISGIFDSSPTQYQHDKLWQKDLEKLTFSLRQQFLKNWSSQLSYSDTKQARLSLTNGVNDGYNDKKYQSKDISVLNDILLEKALLNVGFSKIEDSNISDNQTLSSEDFFLQWQKNIARTDINLGARFIKPSHFANETIYNIAVAKYLGGDTKMTAAYGTAFNAPSLYQLLNDDLSAKGNQNLKPEHAKTIEFGIEKQKARSSVGLRFYKSRIKDLIIYRNTNTVDYHNEDKLNIKGLDLTVYSNIRGYGFTFAHNFVSTKLNNSHTEQLRRPKNTSHLTIKKVHAKFNSRLQVIKKSASLDKNLKGKNVRLAPYTLINLSSQYQYNKDTTFSLNIHNIFDKNYVVASGYNQPGRTINLGVNYHF